MQYIKVFFYRYLGDSPFPPILPSRILVTAANTSLTHSAAASDLGAIVGQSTTKRSRTVTGDLGSHFNNVSSRPVRPIQTFWEILIQIPSQVIMKMVRSSFLFESEILEVKLWYQTIMQHDKI